MPTVVRSEVWGAHGEFDGGHGSPAGCHYPGRWGVAEVMGEVSFAWSHWPEFTAKGDEDQPVSVEALARATGLPVEKVRAAVGFLNICFLTPADSLARPGREREYLPPRPDRVSGGVLDHVTPFGRPGFLGVGFSHRLERLGESPFGVLPSELVGVPAVRVPLLASMNAV